MGPDTDATDLLPSHTSVSASGSVNSQVKYIPQTVKFFLLGSRIDVRPCLMQVMTGESLVPFEEFVSSLNLGDPPRNVSAPEDGMDKAQVKQGSPMKAPRRKPKAPPGFTPPDIPAAKEAVAQDEAAANGIKPTTEAAGTLFAVSEGVAFLKLDKCQKVATWRHAPYQTRG
jgi:hypothetical protein